MNKQQQEAKRQQLLAAEKRICNIKGTLHYTENGQPRQKPLRAHTEKDLFNQAFRFGEENRNKNIVVTQLQHNGQNISWTPREELMSHLCFIKNSLSFYEFKNAVLNQPEKITA